MAEKSGTVFNPKSKARITDSVVDHDRRGLLRIAMAQGIAAPFAMAAFERPARAGAADPQQTPGAAAPGRKGAMRLPQGKSAGLHAAGAVVRDFVDPYLELLRLLREAAEIEHALMLQYLYCAFSLKEPYADLAGYGAADADTIIGVAIQEMQHLSAVNRLLVALGSCPHLDRQDFPYEPDIYPFVFEMEPLSRAALAKYVFVEGRPEIFDLSRATTAAELDFARRVRAEHASVEKSNHIGSLYLSVLDMLAEVAAEPGSPMSGAQADYWREELIRIMDEGEDDHYNFFKSVFEESHPVFAGTAGIWALPPSDPAYPAHQLARNPTAYIGHPNQIGPLPALVLGWLGNLHYWIILSTLDYGYRTGDDAAAGAAMTQMMSCLWPIARALPRYRTGMPFDPLSMGYALGAAPPQTRRVIASFGREAMGFAATVQHRLPPDYDSAATEELVAYMSA